MSAADANVPSPQHNNHWSASACVCGCAPYILRTPLVRYKEMTQAQLKYPGSAFCWERLSALYTHKRSSSSSGSSSCTSPSSPEVQRARLQFVWDAQEILHDYLMSRDGGEEWYKAFVGKLYIGTGTKSDVLSTVFSELKLQLSSSSGGGGGGGSSAAVAADLVKLWPNMPVGGETGELHEGKLLDIFIKAMFYERRAVLYSSMGVFAVWPEEHHRAVYGFCGGGSSTSSSALVGTNAGLFDWNMMTADMNGTLHTRPDMQDFSLCPREKYLHYFSSTSSMLEIFDECWSSSAAGFSWPQYERLYYHESFQFYPCTSETLVIVYKRPKQQQQPQQQKCT